MRRSPIVLAATIAGTAGVLAFHAHDAGDPERDRRVDGVKDDSDRLGHVIEHGSGSGTGSGSGSSGSSTTVSGTATGDAVDTRYGSAQVRVTVKNGKIVAVDPLQLQSNDPHSQQISSSAAPILQQEVLAKQTADVDAVSGATFTSASYTQSVQSALDKLGFKAPDGSVATLQVP